MKPITIIGGGLAGLTLGIALRKRDVPVTIHEAGQYPRHRVCGEFLSGRGLEILKELEIFEQAVAVGGREARTVKFFSGNDASDVIPMPEPALCLSRYRLDKIMADRFTSLGGELCAGSRYAGSYGEGVVRATGRQVQTEVSGWRWIGIKAHALNLSLAADLEMHFRPDAYVGMCQVEDGRVNVCGLFRTREPVQNLKDSWEKWLCGFDDVELTIKRKNVSFDKNSLSIVAGLPIVPFQNSDSINFCVGDAVTMIPPVTGNGMSLAIESARATADSIAKYGQGGLAWQSIQAVAQQDYAQSFGRRLKWAGWFQRGMFHPWTRWAMMKMVPSWPALFRFSFGVTRG